METIKVYLQALPLLAPVVCAAAVLAVLVAPWVTRHWQVRPSLAPGWTLAAMVPLAGLLAPTRPRTGPLLDLGALLHGYDGRLVLVGVRELLTPSEPSLNVWLFVPLGLMTGLTLAHGASRQVALVALAVPVIGETAQGVLPVLNRVGLQWPDLAANLQGLGLGVLLALVLAWQRVPNPGRGAQTPATSCANRTDASISAFRMETDSTLNPNGNPNRRQ